MSSCSTSDKKAEKFIQQLGKTDKVLATDFVGEDKEIIASIQPNNYEVSVIRYSTAAAKVDTVFSISNDNELVNAFHTDNGFMFVTRDIGKFADLRRPYSVYFVPEGDNTQTGTYQKLLVNTDNEYLTCSGYVIDKDAKILTLTSYDDDDKNVTLYQTEYDFNGNQISEDPITYNLKPHRDSSESNATYVWECQYCGVKRNSSKMPSFWDFSCKRYGNTAGSSHEWVKIGRVD